MTTMADRTSDDAAAALLDRKLAIVRESLSCRDLFAEWAGVDARIEQGLRGLVESGQRLAAAQAQMAETEAIACLAVEGKNETERKANKALALKQDAAYQAAATAVREEEYRRAEADAEMESLRRRARRTEKQIDYRIAALRLLGG